MSFFECIILAIVQGIAEFLPISSSGHLKVLEDIAGLQVDGLFSFNILLHFASLCAIVVFFQKKIRVIIQKRPVFILALGIATIPGVLVGYFLEKKIAGSFSTPFAIGISWIITGVVLFIAEKADNEKFETPEKAGMIRAFIIGCFQSIALLPGISRSGMTISGGYFLGLKREAAVEFSLLMSIPIILGATIFQIFFQKGQFLFQFSPINILAGPIITFIVSLFALKILVNLAKNKKLYVFAIYCLVIGIVTVGFSLSV